VTKVTCEPVVPMTFGTAGARRWASRLSPYEIQRDDMTAKIIPWRPRSSVAAPKPAVYLPALIDGQVTVHALIEGLASAGLLLQHDSTTGKFVILPAQEMSNER
jgi:hypothetical protein